MSETEKVQQQRAQHHHKGKSSETRLDLDGVLSALELRAGQVVLDAGCGNGYMAKLFLRAVTPGGRVIALDPDVGAIDALARDAGASGLETIVADITRPTPIAPASVDLVYLSTVFHGFTEPQVSGFDTEVGRLLKPGGILAVVEVDKRETPFGPPMDLRYTPEELAGQLSLSPVRTVRAGEAFYMELFRKDE